MDMIMVVLTEYCGYDFESQEISVKKNDTW